MCTPTTEQRKYALHVMADNGKRISPRAMLRCEHSGEYHTIVHSKTGIRVHIPQNLPELIADN